MPEIKDKGNKSENTKIKDIGKHQRSRTKETKETNQKHQNKSRKIPKISESTKYQNRTGSKNGKTNVRI